MPRVAALPRATHLSLNSQNRSSNQASLKIPLNDDRQEKAVRLQSRQALQEMQMNNLKAAASPVRKLGNYHRAASDSPRTPVRPAVSNKDVFDDREITGFGPSATTPSKRVPLLANFEEWMKMATDNKINANNSWNFALIDYFHDMSLLKEGDGVNFQKASCTLDGCVKIYTSRVDSVATETGKLLSGLADNHNKKHKGDNDATIQDEDEDDEDMGGTKKTKKRAQRSSETTLAPSFTSLQLKKMELEFSVDPLFKKASADFDEGGAKGLLLNHLNIDSVGRIVFDSSDDVEETTNSDPSGTESQPRNDEGGNTEQQNLQDLATTSCKADIDIVALGTMFIPNLHSIDDQDICPALKNFDPACEGANMESSLLRAAEGWRHDKASDFLEEGHHDLGSAFNDSNNIDGLDDNAIDLGMSNDNEEAVFGDGGEAWARTTASGTLSTQNTDMKSPTYAGDGLDDDMQDDRFHAEDQEFRHVLDHGSRVDGHDDLFSYFDKVLRKDWAGPEHWRIKRIKDNSRGSAANVARRKAKEPFEIDFAAGLDTAAIDMLSTFATSDATISMPRTHLKSKTRHLLPDDKHFQSRQLLRLFLKPRASISLTTRRSITSGSSTNIVPTEEKIDEAFWARQIDGSGIDPDGAAAQHDTYDANFFQDDNPGFSENIHEDGDEFADAQEMPGSFEAPLLNDTEEAGSRNAIKEEIVGDGAFGSQLVTQSRRTRPEYVQYARVAKKVDVRRLKEEMWKGLKLENLDDEVVSKTSVPVPEEAPLKFTSVMNSLQQVYPEQAMKDISTSYCFICLLHLANEKGLTIGNEPGLEELSIRKDHTAEVTEIGA